jgi:hypothetical protein
MIRSINSRERLTQLTRLLFSNARTYSVVVVTSSSIKGSRQSPIVPIPALQAVVEPHAKVFWLTGGMISNFNHHMLDSHSIRPSGIRVYLPGMFLMDSGAKHRLWTEHAFNQQYRTVDEFYRDIRQMFENYQSPSSQRRLDREDVKTISAPLRPRRAILSVRPRQASEANMDSSHKTPAE